MTINNKFEAKDLAIFLKKNIEWKLFKSLLEHLGNSLNNIGYIFIAKGEYDQAIEYQKRALQISEELGNKEGMANSLGGIAHNYFNKGEYDQALDYLNRGLTICKEQGYKLKIVLFLNMIGDVYLLKSEYVLKIV